jgi:hypothetical protein
MIGTFDVCRTFRQISKPETPGRETSKISKSYFPDLHAVSASFIVRAMSNSNPAFEKQMPVR